MMEVFFFLLFFFEGGRGEGVPNVDEKNTTLLCSRLWPEKQFMFLNRTYQKEGLISTKFTKLNFFKTFQEVAKPAKMKRQTK